MLLKLILNLQKTKRENLPKYEEKEDLWDQKSYSNKMIKKKKKKFLPNAEGSGVEVGASGRARLFLGVGWEVGGLEATSGSNSHGDTLSGRGIEEGSSH